MPNAVRDAAAIRLWPGVAIAAFLIVVGYGVPLVSEDVAVLAVLVRAACALAIVIWWLFFSRAPWLERVGALALMALAVLAIRPLVDVSIRGGMMGMMLTVYGVPVLALALVAWAALVRGNGSTARRVAIAPAMLLACAIFLLLRTDGVTGAGTSQLRWRWSETREQQLLAKNDEPLAAAAAAPAAVPEKPVAVPATGTAAPVPVAPAVSPATPASKGTGTPAVAVATAASAVDPDATTVPAWPGFRGADRDGVVHGLRIETDWAASPPVQMWRRPIGPGWSSFAVRGDLLYTQEQRGDDEIVACYRVSSGAPVWRHRDPVRFYESNGGAGPRGTPTLAGSRLFAFGATGVLNALNPTTGAVLWSRNVSADSGRRVPDWGFASSPLVVDDIVVVAAAGTLAAYDVATGQPRWRGPSYGGSYSSPHRAMLGGVLQIVLLGGPGAISVSPVDGKVLWEHVWSPGTMVQPALADGDLLIPGVATTGGVGMRRVAVAQSSGAWTLDERWTSNGLKPYFNDYVVHNGYAYGFDGNILAAIDLKDGARKWKGGRYGNGQLVLLKDQDALLVLSEDGELALVSATPDQYRELARVPGIEGKTWNHPAVAGDIFLVRNGEEMAAFRLPVARR
jgi:outer membrane protein assembly factor BamB